MGTFLKYAPRLAIFMAGVAAGCLAGPRRERSGTEDNEELKRSLAEMEKRLTAQESANRDRFAQIDNRLEEQSAALAGIPSTAQLVAAMEQLLSRTMTSLDQRLTTQAHSIDVLKTAVSQNDALLERVLESLDSLQGNTDLADPVQDALLRRPAV